jgi:hypothetical protein
MMRFTEPDGGSVLTEALCVDLGQNLYRVAGIPDAPTSLNYGDEFEADAQEGVLHIRRLTRESGWKTQFYILRREDRDAAWVQAIKEKVEKLGGLWT